MWGWIRRHWLVLAGCLPLIPPATKGALSLVNFGGNIDFVISRSQNPGWVGRMINWLIDPPGWLILPLIALGLTCIYWDAKRQLVTRGTGAGNPDPIAASRVDAKSRELAGIAHAMLERAGAANFKFPLQPSDPFLSYHAELKDSTHPIWTNRETNQLRRDFIHHCDEIGARDELDYTRAEIQDIRKQLHDSGHQLIDNLMGELPKTAASPSAGPAKSNIS
jgi:hypothetical protein